MTGHVIRLHFIVDKLLDAHLPFPFGPKPLGLITGAGPGPLDPT